MKAINTNKFTCLSNLRTFESPDISHRLYLKMVKILKCSAPQATQRSSVTVLGSVCFPVKFCLGVFFAATPSLLCLIIYRSPSGLEWHSATSIVGIWFIPPARSNGFGFSFSDEAAGVAGHNFYFPANFQFTSLPNLGELLASRLEMVPSLLSAVQFRVWCCLENKGERWGNLSLPPWPTLVCSVFLVPSVNFGQDTSRAALCWDPGPALAWVTVCHFYLVLPRDDLTLLLQKEFPFRFDLLLQAALIWKFAILVHVKHLLCGSVALVKAY